MLRSTLVILKYHARLLIKGLAARAAALALPRRRLDAFPAVTLFISSLNTRYPLQLTIETLMRHTRYPNYRLLIGENASTDGSGEYIEQLAAASPVPVEVIRAPAARMHKDWLNDVFRQVTTPYWVAVDSDMLFLGRDWLHDLIAMMESDPELYLLSAEFRPGESGVVEPVAHEVIDLGECPSTWLFCVRTALRERLTADFGFVVDGRDPHTGRKFCYDVGGKLLAEMRARNLKYAHMPAWFRCKYHHFGSMSWAARQASDSPYAALKRHQMRHIQRLVSGGDCPAAGLPQSSSP